MQRLISIVLIYTIVGITFQLDELIKLPVLVNHYYYHSKITPGETILHFLYKHYVQNSEKESSKDQQKDAQLPFKSEQSFLLHLITFIKQQAITITLNSYNNILEFPDTKTVFPSGYSDIWKPPQIF